MKVTKNKAFNMPLMSAFFLDSVVLCKIQRNLSVNFQIHDAVLFRFQQKVFGPFSYSFEKDVNYLISGHNAVGKTSLLQAIKGTLPIRSGSIRFNIDENEEIYEWKRRYLAMVSFADTNREFLNTDRYYQQRFHAFDTDDFTVEEYLKMDGYNPDNNQDVSIIEKCGLAELLPVNRIKLSSGQSRKYLIAKALLKRPKILLLDNPYVGLDKSNRILLNDLIDELSMAGGIQFIIAGQYTELPQSVKHIIQLSDLKVKLGPLHIPNEVSAYFEQTSHWPQFTKVLELHDVNIEYTDKRILDELDWTVAKGEKCAIVGQNGSGKSTLIGLIAGDHPQAYKNNISLFGNRRSSRDSIWDLKKYIGLVSSELHSYFHDPDLSCFAIVKQGLYETIYNNAAFTPIQEQTINALFDYFDLYGTREKRFNHCSTGEQRLVLFLRAIIKNPPLLLLDEPFQALDEMQVKRAKYLLEQILTPEHTMIFITHFKHELPNTIMHRKELQSLS